RILTDPGAFSTEQNDVKNIDLILITHEHQDHLHIDSLKAVLRNNIQAKVITNSSVGNILDKERISYEIVADRQNSKSHGLLIEGIGTKHAVIYQDFGQVENTGYFINDKLFYP